ncbi:MAG: hypothetical protein AMJ54_06785, partial [Deltaproteobacteria bacterium SG8_13]
MNKYANQIIAAAAILLCFWYLPAPGAAESAKELYFQAEACSRKLQDSKKKQKYRANWMVCIEKSQGVYRQDPQGPWAAAGLFMTGSLYRDLYKRSGNPDDNREATQNRPPVSDQYHRAEACYRQLLNNPVQQKYRDRWLPCIKKFEAAYQTNPSDAWASASLYMAGFLYFELYKRSYSQADRQSAVKHFTHVVRQYPKSVYREKARRAIEAIKRDDDLLAVIQEAEKSNEEAEDTEALSTEDSGAEAG